MQKILVSVSIGVITALVITLLVVGFFIGTDSGKNRLAQMIEPQIANAIGGKAEIGALKGNLPGSIILEDIRLYNDNDLWLTTDEIRLHWSPFALMGGGLDVDVLSINGVRMSGMPPSKNPKEGTQNTGNANLLEGLKLPSALPNVVVRQLSLTDIVIDEKFIGRPVSFSGDGSADMGGRNLDLMLHIESADRKDGAMVSIARDPASNELRVKADFNSAADGLVAALSHANGPISLRAEGAAPADAYQLHATADGADFGSGALTIAGNLETGESLTLSLDIDPGAKFEAYEEYLGDAVTARTLLASQKDGLNITIETLATKAATFTGDFKIRQDKNGLSSFASTGALTLSEGERPPGLGELALYVGETVELDATLSRDRDAYALQATLSGDKARLTVDNVTTDLAEMFTGDVAVKGFDNSALPPIAQSGYSAKTRLTLDQTLVKLSSLKASASETAVEGDGAFDTAANRFDFTGALRTGPAFLAMIAPDARALSNGAYRLSAQGAPDDFSVKVDGDTPGFTLDEAETPPLKLEAAFTKLPLRPSGALSLTSDDGVINLKTNLITTGDGVIQLPELLYQGPGFSLSGQGELAPNGNAGALSLNYNGSTGATPWPGIVAVGSFDADVRIQGDAASESTTGKLRAEGHVTTPALSVSETVIRDLKFNFAGSLDAIETELTATAVAAAGAPAIDRLSLNGTATLNDQGSTFTLASFKALVDAIDVTLQKPAAIAIKDGVSVENLDLAVGEKGRVLANAAFSPLRWRMDATAQDFVLPNGAATITGDLALDTNETTIAEGAFTVSSLNTVDVDEAPSISLALTWTEEAFYLVDAPTPNPSPLDIDVRLPIQLLRGEVLSVSVDGPLAGTIGYDGRLEQLASFLPAAFQSIEGDLNVDARLSGDTAAPHVDGDLTIENGAYTDLASGISLVNIAFQANAQSTPTGATARFNGAASGPGQETPSITLQGETILGETSSIDVTTTMRETTLSGGPISRLVASGDVRLSGAFDALKAVGEITVDALDIEAVPPPATGLVAIDIIDGTGDQTAPLGLTPVTAAQPNQETSPLDLDIRINAPGRIFVRGFGGLESEWRADLHILGDAANPITLGDLSIVRGWIDFSGRRFDLSTGEIAFDRLTPNNPTLDLRADYTTPEDVVASIVIGGRAQSPSVGLESVPSQPQDDIMALVLFGKPASELKALETVKLAHAVAQLGGVGPFGGGGGLTGGARSAIGLDLLNVDFDGTGASSLSVGKYVADGLFVSASQSANGDSGAVRVEYEVTNSITVETELRQDGDQKVSANWKRDF